MDAQSYTAQERRAANQVWAAAGAYGFEPLFLARNTDGTIDFYMNCIVGLVHKYYGDALIRDIFSAWEGDTRQPMLDDMAWLYLENAAYRLELPRRPVLEPAGVHHAGCTLAQGAGTHRPGHDPLREQPCRSAGTGEHTGASVAQKRPAGVVCKVRPV